MNKKWSEAEKEWLRQRAKEVCDRELAKEASIRQSRTIGLAAVRKMRQRLGISK